MNPLQPLELEEIRKERDLLVDFARVQTEKFHIALKEIDYLRSLFLVENHGKICPYKTKLDIAVKALERIQQTSGELQPNSGHMYLASVNSIYKTVNKALAEIKSLKE